MTAPPVASHPLTGIHEDPAARRAPNQRWTAMREALHAEATKLRTTPGARWLALAAITLTAAIGAAVSGATTYNPGTSQDPTKLSRVSSLAVTG
jgi:hypothetical protein